MTLKTIKHIAELALDVYQEYINQGMTPEEAKKLSIAESVEANEDIVLIWKHMLHQATNNS